VLLLLLPVVVAGEERKKNICRRERKGLTVDPSGWLVAEELLVAPIGCWNGGERGEEKNSSKRENNCFFPDFGPDFLHFQAMKSNLIYRGWKRIIFSSLEKIFGP